MKDKIDIYGIDDNNRMHYCSDGYHERVAKIHYREERTWDDHMGNTPCGNYFIARFNNGSTKRIYLCTLPEYRQKGARYGRIYYSNGN